MDTKSPEFNGSYLSWNLIVANHGDPIKEMWQWCSSTIAPEDFKNATYINEPYGKEVLSSCFFFKNKSDLTAFKLRFDI